MARKLKINYVKTVNATTLLAKMRVKKDISPDMWYDESILGFEFWYRVGEDPTDAIHSVASCYKYKDSANLQWMWYWARIENLVPGLKYHILATGRGASLTRYKSSVTIESPSESGGDRVMFAISNPNGEWEDFTDCITVPDYKVNNTDITEEWTDANYNVHSNVIHNRIKGSLSLFFRSRERYFRFLACLQYNEEMYGKGRARLKVQVNNELDIEDYSSLSNVKPMTYIDFFKLEFDPEWQVPFYGTAQQYSGMNINIEEIEE